MSSVRKLMQKANSAPPGRMNLPSHGTAEEQFAAILAQRERTSQLEDKLQKFTVKVKQQKDESKTERHKTQWINERANLHRDRKQAQAELLESLEKCKSLLCGSGGPSIEAPIAVAFASIVKEFENDSADCADTASATFTGMMGLRARVASHGANPKRKSRDDHELQEAINHMRAYLDDELAQLDEGSVEDGLIAHDATSKMLKQLRTNDEGLEGNDKDTVMSTTTNTCTMEFVESNCENRIEEVRSKYPNASEEMFAVFRSAILMECERQQQRIDSEGSTLSISVKLPVGVSDDDQLRIGMLIKAYDPARNKSMFGRTRDELYERIAHDMPHINVAQAQQSVHYVTSMQSHKLRVKTLINQTKEETQRLLGLLEDAGRAEQEAYNEELRVQAEAREEEAKRAAYRQQIETLRSEFDERKKRQSQAEDAAAEAERQKELTRQAKLKQEYESRLAELAAHHQAKAEAEARQREVELEMKRLEAEEKLRRSQHNQERVDARQQAYNNKMDELRLQKLLLEEEASKKREAYDAFFAAINAKIGAERDFQRVTQATAASGQSGGYVGAREATILRIHGYTTEKIMSDPRFRIHQALVAANLHQTSYARQVLSSNFGRVGAAQQVSQGNTLAGS